MKIAAKAKDFSAKFPSINDLEDDLKRRFTRAAAAALQFGERVGVEERGAVVEFDDRAAVQRGPAVDLALPAVHVAHQAFQQLGLQQAEHRLRAQLRRPRSAAAMAISASASTSARARRATRSAGKCGVSQGTVTR